MIQQTALVLLNLSLLAFLANCTSNPSHNKFSINDKTIYLELADTDLKRQRGLMHRENLKKDHGMLFVFEQPSFLSFWMKNTKIPLSIAYINENCKITEILKMEPHYGKLGMPPNYPSQTRVNYALEMNQGWFEKNQVSAGDKIKSLQSSKVCKSP